MTLAGGLIVLTACAGKFGAPADDRVALVIGNAAYENARPLLNPINDATDMCAALRRLRFKTLCFNNLRDRGDFEAHVKEYTDLLRPNTVGVVFYSGHGVQVGDANFLIPTRTQLKTARENPLSVLYGLNDLFDRLRDKPTRFQMVFLDACRTELFAQATPAAPGRGVNNSTVRTGLAPIQDAPANTYVLYATASKDSASDGSDGHGPLTKHILANIATPDVRVEDFAKSVISGVRREKPQGSQKPQTPFLYGSFGADFCFAGCLNPPPTAN